MNHIYQMPPEKLISLLLNKGWSQLQIAIEVEAEQSTICRIYSGAHKRPNYQIVDRLRALYQSIEDFAEE